MDSIVLYTEEIDDLRDAAEELFSQLESFPLRKNSIAILFAEEDTNYSELYALLSARWSFPRARNELKKKRSGSALR